MIVRGIDVLRPHYDEEGEHEELDPDHHVVCARTLSHTKQKEPRYQRDNCECGDIDQNGHSRDARRRVEKSVHLRI